MKILIPMLRAASISVMILAIVSVGWAVARYSHTPAKTLRHYPTKVSKHL